MLIRKLIAAYLALAVDPPADPPADPPQGADPPDDDIEDLDLGEDPPEDPAARGGEGGEGEDDPDGDRAKLRAATARAEKAEKAEREAAERLAASERQRLQPPAGPSQEQQLFEQEEAILKDPQSTEQQRYWVNANRTLRDNQRMAREAMFSSRDTADRSDYQSLMATMPAAKKYEKRVEEKVEEFRKQGQMVPRRIALKLLIGDDIVEGRVNTSKKKPATTSGDPPVQQRVDRGRPVHTRSDVRRGAPSESDKRKARLENQII